MKVSLGKLCLIISLLASLTTMANEKFPLRSKYKNVATISINELQSNFNNLEIVDVRSNLEYETLRIKGARHISLSVGRAFKSAITKLRNESKKTIVFYCNGITCSKSYKATKLAMKNGVDNVKTFDLGIMGWANANPDKSVLLGKSPIDKSKLISKADFKKKFISLKEFKKKIPSSILFDVRNKYQKKGADNLFAGKSRNLSLNDANSGLVKAKSEGKTVLVYDAVGKQVRWLQYALEEIGIKKYFFLKEGAKALK